MNLLMPSLRRSLSFFIIYITAIISWFYWISSFLSIVVSILVVSISKLLGSPSLFGFMVENLYMGMLSVLPLLFLSKGSSSFSYSSSYPLFLPLGSGEPPCVRASMSSLISIELSFVSKMSSVFSIIRKPNKIKIGIL